jgi:uncharacterized protein
MAPGTRMKSNFVSQIRDFYTNLDSKRIEAGWSLNYPIAAILVYMFSFPLLSGFLKTKSGLFKFLVSPQIFFLLAIIVGIIFLKLKATDFGAQPGKLYENIKKGLIVSLLPAAIVIFFVLFPLASYQLASSGKITLLSKFAHGRFSYDPFYLIQLLLLAPLLEEIFFRGMIIPPLKKILPLWAVILVSSIIFMLAHGYLKFGALLLGLFTSVIYIWSGSVIPPILFHFTCNLWGPLLLYFLPEVYNTLYPLFK